MVDGVLGESELRTFTLVSSRHMVIFSTVSMSIEFSAYVQPLVEAIRVMTESHNIQVSCWKTRFRSCAVLPVYSKATRGSASTSERYASYALITGELSMTESELKCRGMAYFRLLSALLRPDEIPPPWDNRVIPLSRPYSFLLEKLCIQESMFDIEPSFLSMCIPTLPCMTVEQRTSGIIFPSLTKIIEHSIGRLTSSTPQSCALTFEHKGTQHSISSAECLIVLKELFLMYFVDDRFYGVFHHNSLNRKNTSIAEHRLDFFDLMTLLSLARDAPCERQSVLSCDQHEPCVRIDHNSTNSTIKESCHPNTSLPQDRSLIHQSISNRWFPGTPRDNPQSSIDSNSTPPITTLISQRSSSIASEQNTSVQRTEGNSHHASAVQESKYSNVFLDQDTSSTAASGAPLDDITYLGSATFSQEPSENTAERSVRISSFQLNLRIARPHNPLPSGIATLSSMDSVSFEPPPVVSSFVYIYTHCFENRAERTSFSGNSIVCVPMSANLLPLLDTLGGDIQALRDSIQTIITEHLMLSVRKALPTIADNVDILSRHPVLSLSAKHLISSKPGLVYISVNNRTSGELFAPILDARRALSKEVLQTDIPMLEAISNRFRIIRDQARLLCATATNSLTNGTFFFAQREAQFMRVHWVFMLDVAPLTDLRFQSSTLITPLSSGGTLRSSILPRQNSTTPSPTTRTIETPFNVVVYKDPIGYGTYLLIPLTRSELISLSQECVEAGSLPRSNSFWSNFLVRSATHIQSDMKKFHTVRGRYQNAQLIECSAVFMSCMNLDDAVSVIRTHVQDILRVIYKLESP